MTFKGQASGFVLFNPGNNLNFYTGGRYIPQINLSKGLPNTQLLDLEASANIFGTMGFQPFDSANTNGDIRPYRGWVRYSNPQLEIRVGLQKINFGSASILRPLMWFDQIDPRDPLQLTDGVYGVLGRYYFLNNANIWLWGLYGNKNRRGFDIAPSATKIPEFGGRFQFPTKNGEAAVTYHHRNAKVSELGQFTFNNTPEHRFGIDGKWDLKVGLWVEATWVHTTQNIGLLTNQHLINLGTDYTFSIGSGLTVIAEQLVYTFDEKPFQFKNTATLTAFTASYPLGLFDQVNAILYYDWTNENVYNLLRWQHSFAKLTFNVLAFWNPTDSQLPQQQFSENLFGGKGIQILLVFNH
ncbi:MAG: hypothetical protein KDE26_11845 [Bacteroidetes bacterium]|nr:hypothetical protein [Bacteroidota bacterium]MCB0843937.1 hypothetical protein [Bacteroidota bacterium]